MEIVQGLKPVEQVVFESYGTPLKAMRRIHLWRLADIHQLAYPPGASKDIMLRIIENAEMAGLTALDPPRGMTKEIFWKVINGPRMEYDEIKAAKATGQTNADIMRDIVEGKSYFETVEKSIDDMDIRELRTEVKRQGLKQQIGMSADDLRAVLRGDPS